MEEQTQIHKQQKEKKIRIWREKIQHMEEQTEIHREQKEEELEHERDRL